MSLSEKRILIIIGGGIAAYKVLELIRRLKDSGASVRVAMSGSAHHFVTPLSVSAITGDRVFQNLFDLDDEHEIGHIRLAHETDLIVVAPATADLMAKMAHGLADDLASAVLLATDKKILLAPAMNSLMWSNAATQRNMSLLAAEHVTFVGPNSGEMAESGEAGVGRMAEPLEIVAAVQAHLAPNERVLAGVRMLITSGPTHEPIDPVRYIANRSSGKQGHAIAEAAAEAGAEVTLVSGPVALPDPPGVAAAHVESAREMLAAVERALPADVAIFCAAVADWRSAEAMPQKIKKGSGAPPPLALAQNPDILATIAHRTEDRPALVVGFAAETEAVVDHARQKLARKGCDLIVANDVSPATGVMGGERNTVHLVTPEGVETWPTLDKDEVARRLVAHLAGRLQAQRA